MLSGFYCFLQAENRTEQEMRNAATSALMSNHRKAAKNHNDLKEYLSLSKLKIYGYDNGGFAVISSDDKFESVIGVSSSRFTGDLPCGFKWWVETVNENMQKGIVSNSKKGKTRAPQNVSVAPLITTTWGQGRPYNDNCTYTHGGDTYKCVTGCVATALAQIMNYYRHPASGTGSISYDVNYNNNEYTITYSEDFSQSTYDWDNMLDSYNDYYYTTTVDAHTQAVAKLMRDCGVASKMQYDVNSSGANFIDATYALKNFFSYGNSTAYYNRSNYEKDEWMNLIYNELDNGRPILYGGAEDNYGNGGHAFILNGYNSSGNIYVNWGWDGYCNGYFDIDMLNPSGYQFNYLQNMIVVAPDFDMHTLSVSASGLGRVYYKNIGGSVIRDNKKEYDVKDGGNVTLFFTPDNGRQLESVTVNGTDVTSNISNNQYTISDIIADVNVVVTFESSTNADDVVINSTNFPDEAFQNWILNNIGVASDGVLTTTELESISTIDCREQQIQNLKGIEFFTKLNTLCCWRNRLSWLDVSHNVELTSLDCNENQLTSLNVSNNVDLVDLDCSNNHLSSLDVSNSLKLEKLYCNNNQLTSLNLGDNTTLLQLLCGVNQLTSLDVSKNTALTDLHCYYNQLTSIDVTHNTLLRGFSCSENQLTSLDLSKNSELRNLNCGSNMFTSLDLSHNPLLEELVCQDNQLSLLNFGNITALTSIECGNNQLTSLDVSNCIALDYLNCRNNKLTNLDVSNCSALTSLGCTQNQLTALDVSHNPKLTHLGCHENMLSSLDISHCTALKRLECVGNLLASLDLSKNTELIGLRCEINQLYNLDLSNNSSLAADNSLTCVTPQLPSTKITIFSGLTVNIEQDPVSVLNISEGLAIPVPSSFDFSKVTNLQLDGMVVMGSVVIINHQKFLVFADSESDPNSICGKILSYSYDTSNSATGLMYVQVPLTYTGNATVWTEPETDHAWIYSIIGSNASIGSNAWATDDIIIPSVIRGYTVTCIDNKAFFGCSGLTSLTIPSTVTHMCDYVINGCIGLEKLIVMATTPPSISDVTFIDYDIPLYVPEESVSAYKQADGWKNFSNILAIGQKLGDANGDGEVNVTDIVEIVNAIMNKPSAKFVREAADMNNDNEINVTDIVCVVNVIMGTTNNSRAIADDIAIDNDQLALTVDENQMLQLSLENTGRYVAAQFDVRLAEGQTLENVRLNDERKHGHQVLWAALGNNIYRVVVYNMSGSAFIGNSGELLTIATSGEGNVTLENIIFVTDRQVEKTFAPLSVGTTGIKSLNALDAPADIYDMNGRIVRKNATDTNGLRPGTYLLKGKKILIK